ncbi:MAG TPA: FAD-dependent oxidoreductase, partial [Victivallales bacterium]|nr:FAD-dependent oxidoreductase [Victivallales bacterium]
MKKISFLKKIPVKYNVDIFVAGGGPSGIAAAVIAARQGAKVFLVENTSSFGGMGTSGGVALFCAPTDGVNLTSSGFGTDVYEALRKEAGLSPFIKKRDPYSDFSFNCEVLKRVYDRLAKESKVEFSFYTNFIDVEVENGIVEYAICSSKSGIFAVKAKIYVDATGDADLSVRAGAPFKKGDEEGKMQPATLCSLWCDINWKKAIKSNCGIWQQDSHLSEAIQNGLFSIPDHHLPGMLPIGRYSGWGNIGHIFDVDGTDEKSITRALVHGRQLVMEYENYYKKYLKGYEKMQLLSTGALLGIRETRRIIGDYVLNIEDLKKRAVFSDEIGRFSYPVDIHA